jgi:hypothetical protein
VIALQAVSDVPEIVERTETVEAQESVTEYDDMVIGKS